MSGGQAKQFHPDVSSFSVGCNRLRAVAFAFYKTPVSSTTKPPRVDRFYAGSAWVSYGVMVDGGGPTSGGPVDPWGPYVMELASGLMLAQAATKVSPDLKAGVMAIAAKQVSLAASAIQKNMTAASNAPTR